MNSSVVPSRRRSYLQPSSIEPLEPRIAPAKLLSGSMFTYTDIDGDNVVVKFTKPFLTEANFGTFVSISGGLAGTGPQTLSALLLFTAPNGIGCTLTATPTKSTR